MPAFSEHLAIGQRMEGFVNRSTRDARSRFRQTAAPVHRLTGCRMGAGLRNGEHTAVQRIYVLRGGLDDALARWQRDFLGSPLPPLRFTTITHNHDGTISVEWTGGGTLQVAPTVSGEWQDTVGARSPFTFRPPMPVPFQRLYRWSR